MEAMSPAAASPDAVEELPCSEPLLVPASSDIHVHSTCCGVELSAPELSLVPPMGRAEKLLKEGTSSLSLVPFGQGECNQDIERVELTPRIDWESIFLSDGWEEEGRNEVPCENEMYYRLGLNIEDEAEKKRRDDACIGHSSNVQQSEDIDLGDHITDEECEDYVPDEKRVVYDRMNPEMQPGNLFPNMKEFRIAMRQYAIKHEFELGIEVTSTTRYVGYCKGGDCPWRIYAREEKKGLPAIVVAVLDDVHTCTSSGSVHICSGCVAFLVAVTSVSGSSMAA